jgi:nucleotide-binding universal stress UspA family protein
VPLENTKTDEAIVVHVCALAKFCGASIVLIHVADGFAARNIDSLQLRESEEMKKDRDYLDTLSAKLSGNGFSVDAILANGDPAGEIAAAALREKCDLIAMGTHGHRFVKDILYGSVANELRHQTMVPVLMVREP